jgi:hypothetical protein
MWQMVFVPASETNSATDSWEFVELPIPAGFVRSTVTGHLVRREDRRAYFKRVWDAMDALPARHSGMTAAALKRVE